MGVHLPYSPHLLISKTGVIGPLVTEGPRPPFLALAGEARGAAGLARAVGAHLLVARLAARQDAGLHGHLAEVLQLTVDVEVADAAVEAGAVLPGRLAQGGCHVVLPRHACGGGGRDSESHVRLCGDSWAICHPDTTLGEMDVTSIQSCGSQPGCTLQSHGLSEGRMLGPSAGPPSYDFLGRVGEGEEVDVSLLLFLTRHSGQF